MTDSEGRGSDRLWVFLTGGAPSCDYGAVAVQAASLGTPDEWVGSAIGYLKAALNGTCGGTQGGTVRVSAAAVGLLLSHVEQLEMRLGDIPTRGGAA